MQTFYDDVIILSSRDYLYQVGNGLITTWTKFQVVLASYRGFIGMGGGGGGKKPPPFQNSKKARLG